MSKYKEVEHLLKKIVLPYYDRPPLLNNEKTTSTNKNQLENSSEIRTFIKFFSLGQGRRIIKRIKNSGGGVTEETYDAILGTLFELEYQLNQLAIILQLQELVDHTDPLLIELINAYSQIRIRVNNLIEMGFNQLDGYDKFNHYADEIKRWKSAIKKTVEEIFDKEWNKAVGHNTDTLKDKLVMVT